MVDGYEKIDSKQRAYLRKAYVESREEAIEKRRGKWFFKGRRFRYLPPVSWVRFIWDEYIESDPLQTDSDKLAAFAGACRKLGYKEKTLKKHFSATYLTSKGDALMSLPQNQKALSAIINIINRK